MCVCEFILQNTVLIYVRMNVPIHYYICRNIMYITVYIYNILESNYKIELLYYVSNSTIPTYVHTVHVESYSRPFARSRACSRANSKSKSRAITNEPVLSRASNYRIARVARIYCTYVRTFVHIIMRINDL